MTDTPPTAWTPFASRASVASSIALGVKHGPDGASRIRPPDLNTQLFAQEPVQLAIDTFDGAGGVERVDDVVGVPGARRVDEGPDPVSRRGQQSQMAEKEVVEALALDVVDVLRHLVELGGVHRVRMGDDEIRGRSHDIGRGARVPGVAAELAADPGRNDLDDAEPAGLKDLFPRLQNLDHTKPVRVAVIGAKPKDCAFDDDRFDVDAHDREP